MLTSIIKQVSIGRSLPTTFQHTLVKAPKYLLKPANRIPIQLQEKVIYQIFNHVLQAALIEQELEFLENHWLKIDINDVPFTFYITVNDSKKLVIKKQLSNKPDVTFSGNSQSMLQLMSRNIDPDTLFFQRKLLVTGDTELGLEIKNFLDDMSLERLPTFLIKGLQKYNELAESHLSVADKK